MAIYTFSQDLFFPDNNAFISENNLFLTAELVKKGIK